MDLSKSSALDNNEVESWVVGLTRGRKKVHEVKEIVRVRIPTPFRFHRRIEILRLHLQTVSYCNVIFISPQRIRTPPTNSRPTVNHHISPRSRVEDSFYQISYFTNVQCCPGHKSWRNQHIFFFSAEESCKLPPTPSARLNEGLQLLKLL